MNCDPLARWYRWLEYAGFGRALERRRLEFLSAGLHARRVLMLGEGDGRFLAAFLRQNPTAEVDYVDASREMLLLAQDRAQTAALSRTEKTGRVRFHQAEALAWLLTGTPGRFDFISTHFFLDCFNQRELEMLVHAISRLTTTRACWIISEFRYAPHGLASIVTHGLIAALYAFFRLTTGLEVNRLPEHGSLLEAAGFQRAQQVVARGGLLISELWERGGQKL